MNEFTPQSGSRAGDGEAALRAIAQLGMAPPAPAQAQAS